MSALSDVDNPEWPEIGPDAIERILSATGKEHIPPDLDKEKLADGLADCLATYRSIRERSSDSSKKKQLRRLESIRAVAKRLDKLLAPDEFWTQDSEDEYLLHQIDILIRKIDGTIYDLNWTLRWGPDWREAIRLGVSAKTYAGRWKARSPFEWTAGYYLPQLFKNQFRIDITFHRRIKDEIPDSPTVRFVEQALIELGILNRGKPYSREAIAKALTDARTGRMRKKPQRKSSKIGQG